MSKMSKKRLLLVPFSKNEEGVCFDNVLLDSDFITYGIENKNILNEDTILLNYAKIYQDVSQNLMEDRAVKNLVDKAIRKKGGMTRLIDDKRRGELEKLEGIIEKYRGDFYKGDSDLACIIDKLECFKGSVAQNNSTTNLENAVRTNVFNQIVEDQRGLKKKVKENLDKMIQFEVQKIQEGGLEIEVEAPGTNPNQSLYNRGESTAKTDVLVSLVNLIEGEKLHGVVYLATCGSHQVVSHIVKGLPLYVSNEEKATQLVGNRGDLQKSCSFDVEEKSRTRRGWCSWLLQPFLSAKPAFQSDTKELSCHGANDISNPYTHPHKVLLPSQQKISVICEHGQATQVIEELEIRGLEDFSDEKKMMKCKERQTMILGRVCDDNTQQTFYSPYRVKPKDGRIEEVSVDQSVHIQVNFTKSGQISGITFQHHLDGEIARDDKARNLLFEAIHDANREIGEIGDFFECSVETKQAIFINLCNKLVDIHWVAKEGCKEKVAPVGTVGEGEGFDSFWKDRVCRGDELPGMLLT